MLQKIKQTMYGDLSQEETKRFGVLSLMFFNIIGSYWLLRPLKSGIFYVLVGNDYIPLAKMFSFLFMVPLILFYTRLVDKYSRQRLVYIICIGYASIFGAIAVFLMIPVVGLVDHGAPSKYNVLGWVSFFAIESFGSLIVTLFWSFVASTSNTASAKKGYGLIVLGGQVGSVIGPLLATATEFIGIPTLFLVATAQVLTVIPLTQYYVRYSAREAAASGETQTQTSGGESNKQQTPGLFVGLKLLFSQGYLIGIFGVSTIYEIVGTIMDYQMKVLAMMEYPSLEDYTAFNAAFGVCTNLLSFTIALTGTSFFLRKVGLKVCLLIFPLAILLTLLYVLFSPTLTVIFVAQVILKGLSYAINNPTKEMLYIPTSPDVKFKVKSWIDMFGGRSAKALGATMLDPLVGSVESLLYVGTYISLVVVAVWLGIAYYTGNKFQEQTEERNAANQPAPTKQTAGDQGGIEIELDSVSDGKDHA